MDKATHRKREEILDDLRQIDRLRQGTISEQFYGTGEKKQGPYYVLQGYVEGKHWSKRVPIDQIDQVRADISAGVRFKELCQDFADVTEQATMTQDHPESKKNAKNRKRNATGRPKRS